MKLTVARRQHIERFVKLAEEKGDTRTQLPEYLLEKIPGAVLLRDIIKDSGLNIEVTGYAYMILSAYSLGSLLFMKYLIYQILKRAKLEKQNRIDVAYIKTLYHQEDYFTIHLDFMAWNLQYEDQLKKKDFWAKIFQEPAPTIPIHQRIFQLKKK